MSGRLDALEALLPTLAALAEAEPAREVCGLLLEEADGLLGVRPALNVAADPARRFEVDPRELFELHRCARDGGPQLAAVYHSHPAGDARLSAVDRAALLLDDGSPLLPGVDQIVVGMRGGLAVEVRVHRWSVPDGYAEVLRAVRVEPLRTTGEEGSWAISPNLRGSRG